LDLWANCAPDARPFQGLEQVPALGEPGKISMSTQPLLPEPHDSSLVLGRPLFQMWRRTHGQNLLSFNDDGHGASIAAPLHHRDGEREVVIERVGTDAAQHWTFPDRARHLRDADGTIEYWQTLRALHELKDFSERRPWGLER
jgi:hypothetical protein